MLEALEMWCWRNMQRISRTERKTNEDNRRNKNIDGERKRRQMMTFLKNINIVQH